MRHRPKVDAFSDLLGLVRARSAVAGTLIGGGAWAIALPASQPLKFWCVSRGECFLIVGRDKPIRVLAGDVVLIASPRAHVIATDPRARRIPLADIARVGTVSRVGRGDDFAMIAGSVDLEPASARVVLDALADIVVVRGAERVQWVMAEMVREQTDSSPGAGVALAQLAHLMFIHVLRAHLNSTTRARPSWLRAVTDKRLEPVLRRVHAEPGRSWQLGELARISGMSRAAFAAHFKDVAGCAPMGYLTEWRMHLARRVLQDEPSKPLSELARQLGYASQSSFSNAFTRITGSAPSTHRLKHVAARS